jgi:hypothetical protein
MTYLYDFDPMTGEYLGKRQAQVVNGKALTQSAYATTTPPPASIPEGYVARWTGSEWELVEDHRQHLDSKGTPQGGTPFWLAGEDDWQSPPRYTKNLGPLPAGAITTRPEKPLEQVKTEKLRAIDAETSVAILAGFQCEATPSDTGTPELLHFSYDEFDQQNFADAAVSMQLAAAAGGTIPTSTPWNAYRGHTADSKGELVILQLTAETFVPIYAAALQHKAAKMADGGQRKAAVAAAQTVEEVEAI